MIDPRLSTIASADLRHILSFFQNGSEIALGTPSLMKEVFNLIGPKEIKKIQDQGSSAEHEIRKADDLILGIIKFSCCNKFMRLLRFLFRKKFDEQYDKLSKAEDFLNSATKSLEDQWDSLEEYWDNEMNIGE